MSKGLNKFENKVLTFATGLQNSYKNEEEAEFVGKLNLEEDELTEDFTAMVYAVYVMYKQLTDDDVDFIGFTHLANRLAIQHLMVPKDEVAGGNDEL